MQHHKESDVHGHGHPSAHPSWVPLDSVLKVVNSMDYPWEEKRSILIMELSLDHLAEDLRIQDSWTWTWSTDGHSSSVGALLLKTPCQERSMVREGPSWRLLKYRFLFVSKEITASTNCLYNVLLSSGVEWRWYSTHWIMRVKENQRLKKKYYINILPAT